MINHLLRTIKTLASNSAFFYRQKQQQISTSAHFQKRNTTSTSPYKETRSFPILNGTPVPTRERLTNRTEMKTREKRLNMNISLPHLTHRHAQDSLIFAALTQRFLSGISSNRLRALENSPNPLSVEVTISPKILRKTSISVQFSYTACTFKNWGQLTTNCTNGNHGNPPSKKLDKNWNLKRGKEKTYRALASWNYFQVAVVDSGADWKIRLLCPSSPSFPFPSLLPKIPSPSSRFQPQLPSRFSLSLSRLVLKWGWKIS